jgi:hypothetical protein
MTPRKITILLVLASIVILGGWDIVVAANSQSGDTISEIVLEASLRRPIIPFLAGVVSGHLWWSQPSGKRSKDD